MFCPKRTTPNAPRPTTRPRLYLPTRFSLDAVTSTSKHRLVRTGPDKPPADGPSGVLLPPGLLLTGSDLSLCRGKLYSRALQAVHGVTSSTSGSSVSMIHLTLSSDSAQQVSSFIAAHIKPSKNCVHGWLCGVCQTWKTWLELFEPC